MITSQAVNEKVVEAYEAPRVETVLTPEAIEREVHYAGLYKPTCPPRLTE